MCLIVVSLRIFLVIFPNNEVYIYVENKVFFLFFFSLRSCILNKVCGPDDKSLTSQRLRAFGQVLSVGSGHPSAIKGLGPNIVGLLPSAVRNAVDRWNSSGGNEFPSMGAWVGGENCTL